MEILRQTWRSRTKKVEFLRRVVVWKGLATFFALRRLKQRDDPIADRILYVAVRVIQIGGTAFSV